MTRQEAIKTIINAAIKLQQEPDDMATMRSQLERAQAELRHFWEAKDRPWFCPRCHESGRFGHLAPFGRYGLRCEACSVTYEAQS